ncbi:Spy/CpxP family protein refolding chaperone [Rhodopseudomonas pseudopalustris]|uniref:LTXXQ motif family protein n=1 Tax=Rhodopseudomonas pseudopalustris TaxID=1513892 RepID=A0A1H8SBH2_9BRAD|nr:Spy/CpxP family protein refolding chaperone [Rhodopseudomonas pseudopalustris]MBB1090714.1 Spy/CpxP family protein refolding chaperone [Rhodopseudomonas palustris]SEO76021.1 LTXXQ motif family protein [Rhodopseudomonas pseudopalustris]
MKKVLLAGAAALVLAGSTAAYADHRGWFDRDGDHRRPWASVEDRTAFADARIAAVRAGLKLTPDQEKMWPPLEAAVRDFAKLRIDRAEARVKARDEDRDADPVARLRDRADTMAATAAAMKQIVDAADPLYKSLDEGQKRRLRMLTHFEGSRGGWGEHRHHHQRMHRDDDDRGPRWDRDRDRRPGQGPGPRPGAMEDRDGIDDGPGPNRL